MVWNPHERPKWLWSCPVSCPHPPCPFLASIRSLSHLSEAERRTTFVLFACSTQNLHPPSSITAKRRSRTPASAIRSAWDLVSLKLGPWIQPFHASCWSPYTWDSIQLRWVCPKNNFLTQCAHVMLSKVTLTILILVRLLAAMPMPMLPRYAETMDFNARTYFQCKTEHLGTRITQNCPSGSKFLSSRNTS